jgi:3-methyladenine DNA glycosylase/8-oxoguanine DNA glycosylase
MSEDAAVEDYLVVADNWRPYRSVASWYYWAAVD